MIIPHQLLSLEVLNSLIEDFVTRDGTDNGDETPLTTRVKRVEEALATQQAFIIFDEESQSCSLILRQDTPKEWLVDL